MISPVVTRTHRSLRSRPTWLSTVSLIGLGLVQACTPPAPATAPHAEPAPVVVPSAPEAQPTPMLAPPSTTPGALTLSVYRSTLSNGLRVVLNPDHSVPTVAVCVTYDVGSRNEQKGRSGFAHLFEHMMFQGSDNVPKGGHFQLITARGGNMNGTTSSDRTNYYETLPANELELGIWLEADRMKSLAVTQKNFENQRAVVQEEYRMRMSNRAYALGMRKMDELVFQGYWPYEHDTIGAMADLDGAQLEWIQAFHQSYYAPNNAVVSISGDFQPEEAIALVQKHFGDAKNAPIREYKPPASVPSQPAERHAKLDDVNAKTIGLFYAWNIPQRRTDEHYALELAALILGDGETSVLEQQLIRDLDLAQSVWVWTNDHRGPDMFGFRVVLSKTASQKAVRKVLDEALQQLATDGPTKAQMDKVLTRLKSHFIFGLESNMSRAKQLANYELYWGNASLLNEELPMFLKVTPEAVRDSVAKYLIPTRRAVVEVHPAAPVAPAPPTPLKGTH